MFKSLFNVFPDVDRQFSLPSLKCEVCYDVTGNRADLLITYGVHDKELKICEMCYRDLVLMKMRINQAVGLKTPPLDLEVASNSDSLEHLVLEVLGQ